MLGSRRRMVIVLLEQGSRRAYFVEYVRTARSS